MANRSWREASFIRNTHRSGGQFETSVMEVIKRYTNSVWRNVRVETLLTQTGTTELDIVFYNSGIIYVLELKRVRRIEGHYASRKWKMYGSSEYVTEGSDYTALNVIEQNNIHARSLSDLYFSEFRCFPLITPRIIVPDFCKVPPELQGDIFTVRDLDNYLSYSHGAGVPGVAYRLAYLMNAVDGIVRRSDFVNRPESHGETLRGRRRL